MHTCIITYTCTGSTLTPAATAFAVSIFSQLLLHSFQRIAELVVSAINAKHKSSATERPKESEIIASLEYGKTIVNILLEHDVAMKTAETKPEQKPEIESQRNTSKTVTAFGISVSRTAVVKSKKRQIVDRRRRRRGGGKQERLDSEEEEEEGEESDSDSDSSSSYESLGRVSSDENLSMVAEGLGEDDLELLESLSDSSSSEEEEEEEKKPKLERKVAAEATPTTGADANATKKAGKRHIILAANFNMPPPPVPPAAAAAAALKCLTRPPLSLLKDLVLVVVVVVLIEAILSSSPTLCLPFQPSHLTTMVLKGN